MKKISTSIITLLFIFNLQAQKINYYQDDMTDNYYFFFIDSNEKHILLVSEDNKNGILLRVFFNESAKTVMPSTVTPSTLYAELILEGLNCVEEGFIIIRFEDGERIQINNWKDFNCEGEFYFALDKRNLNLLYSKKIDRIMIQDGRSHRSYTHHPDNPNFFIELGRAVKEPFVEREEL